MVIGLDIKPQYDTDTLRIQCTLLEQIVNNLYICDILCIYLLYYVVMEHKNDIVVIMESRVL